MFDKKRQTTDSKPAITNEDLQSIADVISQRVTSDDKDIDPVFISLQKKSTNYVLTLDVSKSIYYKDNKPTALSFRKSALKDTLKSLGISVERLDRKQNAEYSKYTISLHQEDVITLMTNIKPQPVLGR